MLDEKEKGSLCVEGRSTYELSKYMVLVRDSKQVRVVRTPGACVGFCTGRGYKST